MIPSNETDKVKGVIKRTNTKNARTDSKIYLLLEGEKGTVRVYLIIIPT